MCMYVCMCVRSYVCVYVCWCIIASVSVSVSVSVSASVSVSVSVCASVSVSASVSMSVYAHARFCAQIHVHIFSRASTHERAFLLCDIHCYPGTLSSFCRCVQKSNINGTEQHAHAHVTYRVATALKFRHVCA